MEHIPPTAFPRRAKRFHSYSMTPMDSILETQNDYQNIGFVTPNKFNLSASNKFPARNTARCSQIPETNILTSRNQDSLSATKNFSFQMSEKISGQLRNKQKSQVQASSYATYQQNSKKLANSEIFALSSIEDKKSLKSTKLMRKSTFLSNQGELKGVSYFQQKSSKERIDRKDKQVHVPSFLINKRKQNSINQNEDINPFNGLNIYQNSTMTQNLRFQVEKKRSFKRDRLLDSHKSLENECQQIVFSPPCNTKISFSKATASTLCTNLPREQSRRTFKDFEDLQSLKQIQNSMEESDNLKNIEKQMQNLFRKQEHPHKPINMLQSQIAELFSDEEDQSEETFDEGLKQQLQQLF